MRLSGLCEMRRYLATVAPFGSNFFRFMGQNFLMAYWTENEVPKSHFPKLSTLDTAFSGYQETATWRWLKNDASTTAVPLWPNCQGQLENIGRPTKK